MRKRRQRTGSKGRISLCGRLASAVVLAALLFPVLVISTSAAPVVTDPRVRPDDGKTQVSVGVSEPVTYRVFTLSDPDRVVIDLADARWETRPGVSPAMAQGGVVRRVRHGQPQPGTLRVVIDCATPVQVLDAALLRAESGYRLRLSLSAAGGDGATTGAGGALAAGPVEAPAGDRAVAAVDLPAPPPDARVPDARVFGHAVAGAADPGLAVGGAAMDPVIGATGLAVGDVGPQTQPFPLGAADVAAGREAGGAGILIAAAAWPSFAPPVPRPTSPAPGPAPAAIAAPLWVVAVDPGHGGRDPGAIGISGIEEKQITFATARLLREELRATGRYKVVLTRSRDVFIPLRDRIAIARAAGADLFVSLHADKMPDSVVRGLSVYTLSERASDAEAAALAERENKVDLVAGIDFAGQSREVTNILIGLAQRETMNESVRFAELLTSELRSDTVLLPKAHRFAGFAVLKSPDVPSVLVELGYLSNPRDESLLRSPEHRRRVARSITRAIDAYFVRIEARNRP